MTRDSFIFYRSFYEAISILPRDVQGEIYTAIIEYGLYGKETEQLKPVARSIFALVKPLLDSSIARYENGKKGGRPKTEQKPNQNLTETKPQPYKDVDKDVNEDKKKKVFVAPMRDDVITYFRENGYTEEAGGRAFDYYDAAGWVDSHGQQVRNWKQKCIAIWFKPENKQPQQQDEPSSRRYVR